MAKKKIIALALSAMVIIPSTAFAATSYYSGVILPALSGNLNMEWKTKRTNDSYYKHQVTSLGGKYTGVNVWMETRYGNSTPKVLHRVGQASALVNYRNGTAVANVPVRLKLENSSTAMVRVSASGNYDLR